MLLSYGGLVLPALIVLSAAPVAAQDPPPSDARRPLPRPMLMMPIGTGRSLMDIVARADVQNELRLDLRQRNAVADLSQSKGGPVRVQARVESGTPGDSPEEQVRKQLASQFGGIEEKLKSILKPEQFKRLLELDAQWRGPVALGDSRVAERAQLSPAHRAEINGIVSEYQRERSRIIFENSKVESQGDGTQRVMMRVQAPELHNPLSPVRKALDPLKKQTEEKILKVLDQAERERWAAVQGERFTFRADDPKGASSRY